MPEIRIAFDTTDPAAARWASVRAAALIADVTDETRRAVRDVISDMFIDQVDIDSAAQTIRASVGLTQNQASSLLNFRQQVLNGAGKTVEIGKRVFRVPETVTRDYVNKLVAKKSERLLRDRAFTIAATEAMTASNEGLRQFWEQGQKAGWVSPKDQRVWITTPDEKLCPICGAMEGQTAGINQPFVLPTGQRVMNPPAHPRCRCTQGLES